MENKKESPLTGNITPDQAHEILMDKLIQRDTNQTRCIHCKTELRESIMMEEGMEFQVFICDNCGWWG